MAKVSILGNAIVLTSTLKLEDIKTVKKFRPEALVLVDENKEPVFALNVTANSFGSINKYGAAFGSENADGYAIITMTHEQDSETVRDYIADEFGAALCRLEELETTLPSVVGEAAAQYARIMNSIETVA